MNDIDLVEFKITCLNLMARNEITFSKSDSVFQ